MHKEGGRLNSNYIAKDYSRMLTMEEKTHKVIWERSSWTYIAIVTERDRRKLLGVSLDWKSEYLWAFGRGKRIGV